MKSILGMSGPSLQASRRRLVICTLLGLGAWSAAPSVTLAANSTVSGPGAGQYVIGPGDVLSVTVMRHPEFSQMNVLVPDVGRVNLPVIGTVTASGRTVQQLDEEITSRFKVRLLRPEVDVEVTKPRVLPLYVVGLVHSPGIVEYQPGWHITEALAAAGGLSVDSQLAEVTLGRAGHKLAPIPILPLLQDASRSDNLLLQAGDSLRVFENVVTVNVAGDVVKPGQLSLPVGSGVLDAVALAGGVTDGAGLAHASLHRLDGTFVNVNLYKALRLNDPSQNLPLRDGDTIVVPDFKDRVSVQGAVKVPGFYPLEDGANLKVVDAIARAGGPADGAALTRATLTRADGTVLPLNLYRVLTLGEQRDNVVLHSDDVLMIPVSRGVTIIGDVKAPGVYRMGEGTNPRVSDALAMAGGLDVKPETARINVARETPDGKSVSISIDPVGLLELSDLSQNARIQDGDIISVTSVQLATVSIQGEVKLPSAYQVQEGDSLVDLIARAGGPTPDSALTRVSVKQRSGQTLTVDISGAVLEGTAAPAVPLRDGDTVVVPRNDNRVQVVGAVTRPGSFAIPETRPLTIGEALGLAGGVRAQTKVKQIALLRQTPQGEQRFLVDEGGVVNGQLSINLPVQSGDVIFVPEGKAGGNNIFALAAIAAAAIGKL